MLNLQQVIQIKIFCFPFPPYFCIKASFESKIEILHQISFTNTFKSTQPGETQPRGYIRHLRVVLRFLHLEKIPFFHQYKEKIIKTKC